MNSWLARWLKQWRTERLRRRPQSRCRPTLEELEDRRVPATVELISAGQPPGTPANQFSALDTSGPSLHQRTVTPDGRYVVFRSGATNLVPGQVDTNGTNDIFRHDRQTGETILISHVGDGRTAGNNRSEAPQISDDGRTIVFQSNSTDLVPGFVDGGGFASWDIYLWRDGTLTLLSGRAGSATLGGTGDSERPALSGDGTTVAFFSVATDLVAGFVDGNGGGSDVFRWSGGTLSLLTGQGGSATQGGNGSSGRVLISDDGGVVAFFNTSTDLVAGFVDGNGADNDLYRWSGGTTTLVTRQVGSPTTGANGAVFSSMLSGDGTTIAFESRATDLVAGFVDGNGGEDDVYRWKNGTITLVSGSMGSATQGGNGTSEEPAISRDGNAIAFESRATDLVAGFVDGNGINADIFRWTNGTLALVSGREGSPTQGGNHDSEDPGISRDGSAVVFISRATDLVAGFVDGSPSQDDLFVHAGGVPRLVNGAGGSPTQSGNNSADAAYLSANGAVVVFRSSAGDLVPGDTNNRTDVFASSLPVAGRVFRDADGNGQRDDGGVYGAVVELFRSADATIGNDDDVLLGRAVTEADGTYRIDALPGVNLYVKVTPPQGFAFTTPNTGDDATDSDFPTAGTSDLFVYPATGTPTRDAGLVGAALFQHVSRGQLPAVAPDDSSSLINNSGSNTSRQISDDGRYVVFVGSATNYFPGQVDANNTIDIFRFDRQTGETILISHTGDGVTAGNGFSSNPHISADGGTIIFLTSATNLVAGVTDTNGGGNDVYRWRNGVLSLITHLPGAPTTTANGGTAVLRISGDGNVVAFQSGATDLVAGFVDGNGFGSDIYSWEAGAVSLVSGAGGSATQGANGSPFLTALSSDGSTVVFTSNGTNLVAGYVDNNGSSSDLYRWRNGTLAMVSGANGSATQSSNRGSGFAQVSSDGGVISFTSDSTDLVAGFVDNNGGLRDAYRWAAGTVSLISGRLGSATQGANAFIQDVALSEDGSTVVFTSPATDLVAGFVPGAGSRDQTFRWSAGTLSLLSGRLGSATQGSDGIAQAPMVSGDGGVVAFESAATDLVPGFLDGNGPIDLDLFLWTAAGPRLASGRGGSPIQGGNGSVFDYHVAVGGGAVTFSSGASDLAPGDTNDSGDVFAFALPPTPLTATVNGTGDTDARDAVLTLREAVALANGDLQVSALTAQEKAQVTGDAGVGGTITFDAALNGQTVTVASTLNFRAPGATSQTTITAPAGGLTVSGGNATQVFNVFPDVHLDLVGLTITGGKGVNGGGLFNAGVTTLTGCAVTGNAVAFFGLANGGGIDNNTTGDLTLINCTVSGNSSDSAGGGIYNLGRLTLVNTTVANNTAAVQGGGVFSTGAATTTLHNSLVGDNAAPAGPDVHGTVTANFSLVESGADAVFAAGSGDNVTGQDAKLGPLADNGGPTPTHALGNFSPARDAASAALALGADGAPLTADQRGSARPFNGRVDIGAVESDHFFQEEFDEAEMSDDFTVIRGSFATADGAAVAGGTTPAHALVKQLSFRDVALEADLGLTGRGSRAGLVARYTARAGNKPESYYWARVIERNGQLHAQILRYKNGVKTRLGPSVVVAGDSRHMRFEVAGSSLKLFIDGELKVSVNDSGLSGPGQVGLRARQAGAVDNLTVTPLSQLQAARAAFAARR